MHLFSSVAEEVLSETVPTAFAPGGQDTQDFELHWAGNPIPGVHFEIASGTLQWVRIQEVLVIPRARLVLDVDRLEAGNVLNAGFVEAIVVDQKSGHAEIPIALISGEKNPITVSIKRDGKAYQGRLLVRFKPRFPQEKRVYVDSSCSPFQFKVTTQGQSQNDWVYVGCRLVRVLSSESRTSSLEAFVYWDNVGQSIQVGGIDTPSSATSIWSLRLKSSPGATKLRSGDHEITLEYKTPKNLRDGFLGLGVGPYDYNFEGNGSTVRSVEFLLKIYGSYFITESVKVVAFGATALDQHLYTDLGLYLSLENFRFLDRRLGINILLGVHGVGFALAGQYNLVTSFPQGIELVYNDAFKRGCNIVAGAFIYPPIGGNTYYNAWIRWGNEFFGEFDYYVWEAQPHLIQYKNSSVGVSFGFPIFNFL